MFHHPALADALARDRVAELRRSAQDARSARPTARSRNKHRRPSVVASFRLRTGWLLVDMGLRLAVPRGGVNRRVASGRR